MRLIGVLDLLGGRAVHARGGIRETYMPVHTIAGSPVDGNPLALARTYVDRFGLTDLYAADLDAILQRPRQDALVAALAAVAPLWVDAGVSLPEDARHVLALGAARVIIGLETLSSFEALSAICAAVGGDRVVFSLDLHDGEPVVRGGIPAGDPAHLVAARAVEAGVGAVIVIDLGRVGTGTGLDFALIARVRSVTPGPILLAGGGVRGVDDLTRLADAGCDGALVASALHDGRLAPVEVEAARRLGGHLRATR